MNVRRESFLRDLETGHPVKGSFITIDIDGLPYKVDEILERLNDPTLFFAAVQSNQQYGNIQGNLSNISNQLISQTSFFYQNMKVNNSLLNILENERYEKAISKFRKCVSDTEVSYILDGTYLPNSLDKLKFLFGQLNCSIDDLLNYFSNDVFVSSGMLINDEITNDIFYRINKSIDYMLAVIIQTAIIENTFTVKNKKKAQAITQIDAKVINGQLKRFYQKIEDKLFKIKNDVASSIFNYFYNQINCDPFFRNNYRFFSYDEWVNYMNPPLYGNRSNWDYRNDLCWDLEYHISFYVHLQELEKHRNIANCPQQFDEFISFLINEYTKKYNFRDLGISSFNDIISLYPELITRILIACPPLPNHYLRVLLYVEELNGVLRNNYTFDQVFEKFRKNKGINLY